MTEDNEININLNNQLDSSEIKRLEKDFIKNQCLNKNEKNMFLCVLSGNDCNQAYSQNNFHLNNIRKHMIKKHENIFKENSIFI